MVIPLYLQVPTSLPGLQHVALNCVGDKKAPGCIISTHPSFLSKEAQAKETINSWHDRIEKPWKYLLHECCTTIFRVSPYSLATLSVTACLSLADIWYSFGNSFDSCYLKPRPLATHLATVEFPTSDRLQSNVSNTLILVLLLGNGLFVSELKVDWWVELVGGAAPRAYHNKLPLMMEWKTFRELEKA